MAKVTLVARYLLALMMVVFGLNKFLNFMPAPELSGDAAAFMGTMVGSFIWPTLGILYIAGGLLLAANKAVGLATILLAPAAFSALMFHITLDPANLPPAIVFVVLLALVMVGNASKYRSLLS
ncbi:DoxX protein [Pelagicoccus sp. NFK12]|uniref:DoxX protein n=1 Tax=Pelagicoccus enzymogenes TaxID=2773457 RepID=A0A927F960_9BACT|nr:DoxX protein [Pelagicoccus enzymogenes]MBD5780139.1 DoxX protein [Pelagicoccus enzymogenes]MDQ8199126.1 hypothetical protein [Pelagicoccus enzymogenes]